MTLSSKGTMYSDSQPPPFSARRGRGYRRFSTGLDRELGGATAEDCWAKSGWGSVRHLSNWCIRTIVKAVCAPLACLCQGKVPSRTGGRETLRRSATAPQEVLHRCRVPFRLWLPTPNFAARQIPQEWSADRLPRQGRTAPIHDSATISPWTL